MAAKTRSGGTQRVLQKLNKSIEDGEYYEAHQLIRTVYFRLVFFQDFHMGLQKAGERYLLYLVDLVETLNMLFINTHLNYRFPL